MQHGFIATIKTRTKYYISLNECWANIDGLKVRYLESGKENKRHVLFIHGLGLQQTGG
jgi:hypothetical protein